MKHIILSGLFLCCSQLMMSQLISNGPVETSSQLSASHSETPAQIVEKFFTAFHAQDTTAMRQLTSASILQQTIVSATHDQTEKLIPVNFNLFLERIASMEEHSFKEDILSYEVSEAGGMSHVWTAYSFSVNGNFSHKGVNSFLLVSIGGHWKIAHIIDTRTKD